MAKWAHQQLKAPAQQPPLKMYAPGRIQPAAIDQRATGQGAAAIIIVFVIVILLIGCVAVSTLNSSTGAGAGAFFAFIGLCLGAPLIIVLIKVGAAGAQKNPQQVLADNQADAQRQEQQRKERAYQLASTFTGTYLKNGPGNNPLAILGAPSIGPLAWACGGYATLPESELAKHLVVIGGSGSGKTVTLLRIALLAASVYKYRVFFVDGKGDRKTAVSFIAMMQARGIKARMFPREQFNGWKGDGPAILNRLMEIVDFSEPFYRDATRDALVSACLSHPSGQPPRSSSELLARLTAMHAASPNRTLEGVLLRYRSFFGAIRNGLDNGFSFDDCNAAYLLLDGLSLKEQAQSLGRFFIEDFGHYAAARKQPGKDLLIIDEFSAIALKSDAANLFERLRSYDCAIIASSQSYAGLGKQEDAERILDAANAVILHRTAAPEPLTARAGRQQTMQQQLQFGGNFDQQITAPGRAQWQEDHNLHPDYARRLQTGEAAIIAHGQYMLAYIARAPEPDPAALQQVKIWIEQPTPQALPPGPQPGTKALPPAQGPQPGHKPETI